MTNVIGRLFRETEGQDLVEYALLGSFIALAAFLTVQTLGVALNNYYAAVGSTAGAGAAQAAKITF